MGKCQKNEYTEERGRAREWQTEGGKGRERKTMEENGREGKRVEEHGRECKRGVENEKIEERGRYIFSHDDACHQPLPYVSNHIIHIYITYHV